MKTSEMILQAMSEIASRQFAEAYNTLSLAYDEAKKSELRTLALHGDATVDGFNYGKNYRHD